MEKKKRKHLKDKIETDFEQDVDKAKRKRKKKNKVQIEGESNQVVDDSFPINEDFDLELENGTEIETNNDILEDEVEIKWEPAEMKTLLLNIQKCLPKSDLSKYSTTLEKSIDWEQVKFDKRNSKECKSCALMIMKKLRRYRTLTEMLVDAFEWVESPWKSLVTKRITHPDLPKKPMSAYLRYFQEKRPKLQAQYPTLSMTELAKIVAEKFSALSEKKKAKYKKIYEKELIDYRQKVLQFKKEHPDIYKTRTQKKTLDQIGPSKPRTPFQLYKENKIKKLSNDNDLKAAMEKIRDSWNNISENKRYKFIRKSLQDQERYKAELEEFIKINPSYEPPKLKPLLSKSESELKYKFEGMPERPPNSGYMLFSQMMLKEVKDVPAKEKMVLIAKRWKEMTESERAKYNEDAHTMMSKYIVEFDEYLQNLPEDEKEKVIVEQKFKLPSEKKIRQKINKNDKNSVENMALIAYQMEEINRLQIKYPQKPKSQIIEMINNEWKQMNTEQKSKYINLAESIQDYISTKPVNMNNNNNNNNKTKKFKDEKEAEFFNKTGFKRPRPAGFVIFCHKVLSSKNDLATRDRLKYASNKWKEMSEDVKKRYNDLAREKYDLYNKLLEQYKESGELPNEKDKEFMENFSIEKCKNKNRMVEENVKLSGKIKSSPSKQCSGIDDKHDKHGKERFPIQSELGEKNKRKENLPWSNVMYSDSSSSSFSSSD